MALTNDQLLELADEIEASSGLFVGKRELSARKTHEIVAALRWVVNQRVNPIVKIVKEIDANAS